MLTSMRSTALWLLARRIPHRELAELVELDLDPFEVVSLDVFDTCLGRAVLDPTDLFELVPDDAGVDLTHVGDTRVPGPWFRSARVAAEQLARRRAGDREIGMQAIYESLADVIPDRDTRRSLMEAELRLERRFSVARQEVKEFALRVLAEGRHLVYLSDMYLSSSSIGELLTAGGFPHGEVLVSNEIEASKARGDAFALVARHFGVPTNRVLHVGDNLRVDGIAARRAGAAAVVIDRAPLELRRPLETHPVADNVNVGDSVLLGLAANIVPAGPDTNQTAARVGTSALGTVQLAFASWLLDNTSPDEALLFCSRDMRDVMALYQRIAARAGRQQPCHYLEISRRSVGFPAIATGITSADRELFIGGRGEITERDLWARLGLSDLCPASRYSAEPLAIDAREPVWLRVLSRHEAIVSRAREELEQFREYWLGAGLPTHGPAVLVDVGWRATAQNSLQRCLAAAELAPTVRGMYIGLLDSPPPGAGGATGWLVDAGRPTSRRVALEAGIPIVELLFQADEGSVERYEAGRPVRGPRPTSRAVQDVVQASARELHDRWFELGVRELPSAVSASPMLRLLNSPRPAEARALGAMRHTDRLGASEPLRVVLPERVSPRQLLPSRHAARLIRSSEWRPGLFAVAGTPTLFRRASTSSLASLKVLGRALRAVRPHRSTQPPAG